jgi:hypothetical protein
MSSDKRSNDNGLAWAWVVGLTAATVVYRVVPYLFKFSHDTHYIWNLTPVGALALFAGARLRSRLAYLVPLVAMALSDLLLVPLLAGLGKPAFSWITPVIYAAFMIEVAFGRLLRDRAAAWWVGGAAVLGATQFYLLTNFAVWLRGDGTTYAKTVAGLVECYVLALPFYRNMLYGNLLYAGLFFGLYAVALRVVERRKAEQPA